jgi:hypothetical protein
VITLFASFEPVHLCRAKNRKSSDGGHFEMLVFVAHFLGVGAEQTCWINARIV